MAFIDDWALLQDNSLKQRMLIACSQVASETIGENTAGTGSRRDKRHALALAFLNAPHQQIERFMLAIVALNHPANANVTDAQILTAVRASWDDLAGVHTSDT